MFKIQNLKPRSNTGLFIIAVVVMLVFAGCAVRMRKPRKVCPEKAFAAKSLSLLKVQSENAVPLKAYGRCLLRYHDENGKPKKGNFPVKLWMNPPAEIYMQGDIAFNPKGVVLGSNKDEFWLAVRLKEANGYWWGRWSEVSHPEKLMISPRLVLEALGVTAVEDNDGWLLSKEKHFDVLTKQEDGFETEKIYIDTCDYLVRKIEYFDGGRTVIIMELDKYKEISKNFFVPAFVKIVNFTGGKGDSVQITLGSVKPMEFTEKQLKRLFVRPQPQGFKRIYQIVDGKIIEQPE